MTEARAGRVVASMGGLFGSALWPYLATRLPLLLAGVLSVALVPVNRYVPDTG